MMIFNELRKHGRLASKRHPMYEKNKVAKIFGYIGVAFWAGYLIFFGTTFAFGFADMVPNREPYHVMNAVVLIFILALDFLLRVPFQNTDAGGKALPPAAGKTESYYRFPAHPFGIKPLQPVLVVYVHPFFLHYYYQVFRYLRCIHLSHRHLVINRSQQLLVPVMSHTN